MLLVLTEERVELDPVLNLETARSIDVHRLHGLTSLNVLADCGTMPKLFRSQCHSRRRQTAGQQQWPPTCREIPCHRRRSVWNGVRGKSVGYVGNLGEVWEAPRHSLEAVDELENLILREVGVLLTQPDGLHNALALFTK